MKKLFFIAALCLRSCQPLPAGIVSETIWHEARGESLQGRYAVASVIWTRHIRSGRSLNAVCKRDKQFSCWNTAQSTPKPKNDAERALLVQLEGWEFLMERGIFVPSGSWGHYLRVDCFPSWRKDLTNRRVIGNHLFGECK